MIEAGCEDKRITEMKGRYHEGVPALQLMWMGVGQSVATNTPTMRSPGLVL